MAFGRAVAMIGPLPLRSIARTNMPARPRLAVTLGDVAGVGPEVTAAALADPAVRARLRPLVVGDAAVLRRALTATGVPLKLVGVDDPTADGAGGDAVPVWNPLADDGSRPPAVDIPVGVVSAAAGRYAHDWLVAAADLALAGTVDGLVTAPLHKEALAVADVRHPGHTEILAERCGVAEVRMTLHLPPPPDNPDGHALTVAHATLHTSIRSVPDLLTRDRVAETVRLIDRFLVRLGRNGDRRRVGVCALNPHAGEHGLFGTEEADVIEPAVADCVAGGIAASGPFPADTLFRRAAAGEFDGVAAMYHDQGHVALRLIGWGRAVNVTLGLPVVRTSPSHGTAFDLAGRGTADPTGMTSALLVAADLAAVEQASSLPPRAAGP